MLKSVERLFKLAAASAVFVAMTGTAEAGPPLICHPFDTGSAAMLPWGPGTSWNAPERSYDLQKLTADTLRLLAPSTPILARMETMRRATIYASQDTKVADALLKAVLDRARAVPKDSRDPLPWFDAGYLIESYSQMRNAAIGRDMLAGAELLWPDFRNNRSAVEGYSLVRKAIQLSGANAEMEFAASLMQQGAAAEAHRQRATAGAPTGSLLAKNLSKFER
jgi:hypothetical protein